MLGDVIMRYIQKFLNSTTLTKKINNLFKTAKEKYNKSKRFKKCTINFDDYEFLLLKKKNGQQLSKNEIKCLHRFKEIFDVNLINQFSKNHMIGL